ncbi:hypothetical protein RRG08_054210 [Elysia crispata]|uniref:Uncharacterized protein n=1 Tax=Elysia crispata TaxID=231223 RepID=A0AAE0YDE0_9GAST|nr:hypothetical protein RRG08_054210 [Elysia crispata]
MVSEYLPYGLRVFPLKCPSIYPMMLEFFLNGLLHLPYDLRVSLPMASWYLPDDVRVSPLWSPSISPMVSEYLLNGLRVSLLWSPSTYYSP